jgi:hypothetical protein
MTALKVVRIIIVQAIMEVWIAKGPVYLTGSAAFSCKREFVLGELVLIYLLFSISAIHRSFSLSPYLISIPTFFLM